MQGRLSTPRSNKIQEFPWETWDNEFSLANQLGLSLIEWTVDLEKLRENPFFTHQGQKMLSRLSSESLVSVVSMTLDCFVSAPVHKINPLTNLNSSIDDFIWVVNAVANTSVETLVLPIVAENGPESKESIARLCDFLTNIHDILKESDMRVAIECELDTRDIKCIANSVQFLENIGFNFDIGNSAAIGNIFEKEIDIYGDKIFNVHIKDRLRNGVTVPLGEGDANLSGVFGKLREIEYKGNFILQAARKGSGSELDTIKDYIEFCLGKGLCI